MLGPVTMSFFGTRKSRPSRTAALKSTHSLPARINDALKDRSVLPRLFMGLLATLLLLVATQSWRIPFRHRIDDRPPGGIAARIKFSRTDPSKTKELRDRVAAEQPLAFKHAPEPLGPVFASHLRSVIEAEKVSDVLEDAVRAFGFNQLKMPEGIADSPNESFLAFRVAAISRAGIEALTEGNADSTGIVIEKVKADFEDFVLEINDRGTINPADLTREEIVAANGGSALKLSDSIEIVLSDEGDQLQLEPATVEEVMLDRMLENTGSVGKLWSNHTNMAAIRPWLTHWLEDQVKPTLFFDANRTELQREAARAKIPETGEFYSAGRQLVAPGELITSDSLEVLKAEYHEVESHVALSTRAIRVVTAFLMFLVMAVLFGIYLFRAEKDLVGSLQSLTIFLGTCVLTIGVSRLFSVDPWRAEVVPLLAVAMIFAIAFDQLLAMITSFLLSLVICLSTVGDIGQFVVLLSVSATAIILLSRVSTRSTIIKVGFYSAIVGFIITWGTGVVATHMPHAVPSIGDEVTSGFLSQPDLTLLNRSLWNAGCCVAAGFLVTGSLPFIESRFGIVTDISLLEMSDPSHPLLQELVRRAPGTYNHSITMGSIGEKAADAVGANGLLVRVGAYFHDIGKMLKPEYFIENSTPGDESRHEHLAPAMSTLIIIGHVKDGVDLAKRHHLPPRIIDFIEQHHGTTLVEYFYHEATRQADEDHKTDAEESSFRYPGPKPQTPEAGVMMLADAVESASRTLSDPTPKRIETLVHEITLKRLLDGQFDECSLKMDQIHTIEESLVKSLIAVYHGRVKYPDQQATPRESSRSTESKKKKTRGLKPFTSTETVHID